MSKICTTIEQSRKLAEILPLESADMLYWAGEYITHPYMEGQHKDEQIPIWSLAALLDVLPFPQLSKDKTCTRKVGWTACVCPNDCRYVSCWHNNPIDACVEMIEKLNELNLL